MDAFAQLQERLARAYAASSAGSTDEHVLVVMPSFSLAPSLLAHYARRLAALEHRYLVSVFLLTRIPGCELVFLTCRTPAAEVVDYLIGLLPEDARESARSRLRIVAADDDSARSVAEKLLDRPDLVDDLRRSFAGRPVLIEPWNVTEHEVDLALRLDAPIAGTAPELWPLGFKSAGRRLFREAGVPVPAGREDLHTIDEVVAAIEEIRGVDPSMPGVVVKHDDSGGGDGNAVLDLRDVDPGPAGSAVLRARLDALPEWYRHDLRAGSIVEELVTGDRFATPSVQVDISPTHVVTVLSTHEQIVGGAINQVFVGCRFPADPAYAADLARHGAAVGKRLADAGVVGRFSLDFAAAADASGRWQAFALELNLRKGGTTHPYTVLRNLVPGRYDADLGRWVTPDGGTRVYCASDNVGDARWFSLTPAVVIDAVRAAGLEFDHSTGTGVVLHLLSALGIDGSIGVTAIGRTREEAEQLYAATRVAVDGCV